MVALAVSTEASLNPVTGSSKTTVIGMGEALTGSGAGELMTTAGCSLS